MSTTENSELHWEERVKRMKRKEFVVAMVPMIISISSISLWFILGATLGAWGSGLIFGPVFGFCLFLGILKLWFYWQNRY